MRSGVTGRNPNVLSMLEVEGDIFGLVSDEQCDLAQRVGIADLVEHIWVSPRHIGDDDIGFADLVEDPIKHALGEYLLVEAFGVRSCVLRRALDAELVDVVEGRVKGHQHEDERLRACWGDIAQGSFSGCCCSH